MKGLRKVLTPFAPDQSGAVSVLYSLGGILIIVDAGGCAGNICGFDEPRWATVRSAVFSAGLRDMDAVMGRDRLLVKKTVDCVRKLDAGFVAFIGTPVPAVIGTDFQALKRMLEQKLAELALPPLPVLSIPTDGMHTFERGEELAYMTLLRELDGKGLFTVSSAKTAGSETADSAGGEIPTGETAVDKKRVGLFGVTPLDLPDYPNDKALIAAALRRAGFEKIIFYGLDADLSDYEEAPANALNIAVSADGIAACRFLEEKFQTPYRVDFPGAEEYMKSLLPAMETGTGTAAAEAAGRTNRAENILIVHSSVFALSLQKALQRKKPEAQVTVASWFESKADGVIRLTEEDDFVQLVSETQPDIILADEVLKKLIPDYGGTFVSVPEFALSGKRRA